MHDIEPHFKWRHVYIAAEDQLSPFYGRTYDEFTFKQKIYNYYIHPQWDEFGSSTLYMKILQADYNNGYAIIELIGEWNDCLQNDVMFLKRNIVDELLPNGISKYILVCENVLNFHGSDDCYYEEWFEDVKEEDGWICFLNILSHVQDEMQDMRIQHYVNLGQEFNDVTWRPVTPKNLFKAIDARISGVTKQLTF